MESLDYIKTLGCGTFGDVYLCRSDQGEDLAVKRFYVPRGNPNVGIINLKELNVMQIARGHPNLMSMTSLWTSKPFKCKLNEMESDEDRKGTRSDKIFIGMQAADMTLLDLVKDRDTYASIPGHERIQWCAQMLNGLLFLHQNNIVHRDLKTNNILVVKQEDGKYNIKLTDYGCSRPIRIGDLNTREFGNINYNAPEHLFVRNLYDKGVDIWSLAICIIETLTGIFVFDSKDTSKLQQREDPRDRAFRKLNAIFTLVGVPSESIYNRLLGDGLLSRYPYQLVSQIQPIGLKSIFNPETNSLVASLGDQETIDNLVNLIEGMMEVDTEKRLSCSDALNHPALKPYMGTIKICKVNITAPGNPHWMEGKGITVFKNLLSQVDGDLDHAKITKMVFLGLDIYHRVSQYIHSNPTNKNSKCLTKVGSVHVAACCIYLGFKYYTDMDSLPFTKIFEGMELVDSSFRHVETVEKVILQIIDYRITRPYIFDYIKRQGILGRLFHYLTEESDWCDKPPDQASVIFNEE